MHTLALVHGVCAPIDEAAVMNCMHITGIARCMPRAAEYWFFKSSFAHATGSSDASSQDRFYDKRLRPVMGELKIFSKNAIAHFTGL
jgi:hypothetical protein